MLYIFANLQILSQVVKLFYRHHSFSQAYITCFEPVKISPAGHLNAEIIATVPNSLVITGFHAGISQQKKGSLAVIKELDLFFTVK